MRLQASKANGGLRTSSLTRDFKETVNVRIERDPAFRHILLEVGEEWLLAGDVEAGKSILRIHVVAQWTGWPAFKLRPDGTQGSPGRRCGTANPVGAIWRWRPPDQGQFPGLLRKQASTHGGTTDAHRELAKNTCQILGPGTRQAVEVCPGRPERPDSVSM